MYDEKELKEKLIQWDSLHKQDHQEIPLETRQKIYSDFDKLLKEYNDSNDATREMMRSLFKEHRNSRDLLFAYWNHLAKEINSIEDENKLRLGLAAISLEDFTYDWRDSLVGLSLLFMAATDAGIDPNPIYKKIGEISNKTENKSKDSVSKSISSASGIFFK